jgi:hypothetical protein
MKDEANITLLPWSLSLEESRDFLEDLRNIRPLLS